MYRRGLVAVPNPKGGWPEKMRGEAGRICKRYGRVWDYSVRRNREVAACGAGSLLSSRVGTDCCGGAGLLSHDPSQQVRSVGSGGSSGFRSSRISSCFPIYIGSLVTARAVDLSWLDPAHYATCSLVLPLHDTGICINSAPWAWPEHYNIRLACPVIAPCFGGRVGGPGLLGASLYMSPWERDGHSAYKLGRLCVCAHKAGMSAKRGVQRDGGGEAGKLHVLAVDDSSVSRKLIEKLLKASPYRVTVVDSGRRALEVLGEGRENGSSPMGANVNLIITDYSMPEMTGYELLKRVKGSSALRNIPVVIMSSENLPNRVSRCMEEGAEDFLIKPLRPADVPRLMSIMSASAK